MKAIAAYLTVWIALVSQASSLMCYQCTNLHLDTPCGADLRPSYLRECAAGRLYCGVVKLQDTVTYTRGCVKTATGGCGYENGYKICRYSCQSDGCNNITSWPGEMDVSSSSAQPAAESTSQDGFKTPGTSTKTHWSPGPTSALPDIPATIQVNVSSGAPDNASTTQGNATTTTASTSSQSPDGSTTITPGLGTSPVAKTSQIVSHTTLSRFTEKQTVPAGTKSLENATDIGPEKTTSSARGHSVAHIGHIFATLLIAMRFTN